MGNVDRETKPSYVSFWLDDNKEQLAQMRADWKTNVGDSKDEEPQLVLNTLDGYSIEAEELYLDTDTDTKPEIYCSFIVTGAKGKASVTVSIPLSDVLLMDILSHSVKKLNKLKTAMEALQ